MKWKSGCFLLPTTISKQKPVISFIMLILIRYSFTYIIWNYLNSSGVLYSLVNLRNRKEEERRWQTLCDKRDSNNLFEITFHQTSLSFKKFFL